MARRQKPNKKHQNPQIWFPDDIAELLAWLDRCIEYGDNFELTVRKHLKATRKKQYTWDQISTKLRKIWAASNRQRMPLATSSELLRQGTKCLPLLDSSLVGRIERLKLTFISIAAHRSRYRLRSTSTLLSEAAAAVLNRESRQSSPLSSVDTTPPLTPSNETCSSATGMNITSSDAPNQIITKIDSSRDSTQRSTLCETAEPRVPSIDTLQRQAEEYENSISHLQNDLMIKENHILQLKIDLDSTNKEFKELKQCLKIRANSDPMALVAQLQYSVSYLKQQLDHVTSSLKQSRSRTEQSSTSDPWKETEKRMYTLERDILNGCTNLQDWAQDQIISNQALLDHRDSLEPLARRVFTPGMPELKQAFAADLDTQLNVLRTLVIASVFISVFESDVFGFLAYESVLLGKYRECLLLTGMH